MFQIDVSVNAPESGTIKEFLANEEDTVTVGQELVKLELGGAPEPKGESAEKPKEPATADKPKSPAPEETKEAEPAKPSKPETEAPKQPPAPKQQPSDSKQQPSEESKPSIGGREERRVCSYPSSMRFSASLWDKSNLQSSMS